MESFQFNQAHWVFLISEIKPADYSLNEVTDDSVSFFASLTRWNSWATKMHQGNVSFEYALQNKKN